MMIIYGFVWKGIKQSAPIRIMMRRKCRKVAAGSVITKTVAGVSEKYYEGMEKEGVLYVEVFRT